MAPRHSSHCDGCGKKATISRFVIRNRHGTEWYMDYCPACAEPLERGKGINLLKSSTYQRFKVVALPKQSKRK